MSHLLGAETEGIESHNLDPDPPSPQLSVRWPRTSDIPFN